MPKSIRSPRGFRCADGRLHATIAEANACLHHPADKNFDTVNLVHPPIPRSTTKLARPGENVHGGENVDNDGELPAASPFTPAHKTSSVSAFNSPSPLANPGLPTPPVSQPLDEEMGDNIVVTMVPSSQVVSSSPAGAIRRSPPRSSPPSCGPSKRHVSRTPSPGAVNSAIADNENNEFAAADTDDIPGPLSSSPPPAAASARTPPPAAAAAAEAASTTHITETNPDDDAASSSTANTDAANTLLALRADRARLTDALATSTFRAANLLTRAKLARIDAQLARRESRSSEDRIQDARAEAAEAWGAVEDALAAARNAWVSAGIISGIVVAYAVWCWIRSVEMAYVRKRTCVGFGMREDC